MDTKKTVNIIKKQFNENINSHVFLVETDDIDKCLIEVKEIIKNALNNETISSNQIDEEIYLEWIIIRPDGKEIKKDAIFNLQERLKTKPILSNYLFYTIINAEKMNEISSNKLLKTIEEPHDGIIGFIITEKIDQIIPTIKSRCEYIQLIFNNKIHDIEDTKNIEETTEKLLMAIENDDLLEFNLVKRDNPIIKDYGIEIANLIKNYYNNAVGIIPNCILNENIIKLIHEKNDYKKLIKKSKYMNLTINKLISNMNMDLLLEKIFIEIRK